MRPPQPDPVPACAWFGSNVGHHELDETLGGVVGDDLNPGYSGDVAHCASALPPPHSAGAEVLSGVVRYKDEM